VRKIIHVIHEKCVACNQCIRSCPVEEANIVREIDDKIVVEIDYDKCIACGSCLLACHHGARHYEDDTERFFADLKRGERISMFVAPAAKANFNDLGRVLTWLRELGVDKIYDSSLGADICVWAHVQHIRKNGKKPLISQPCPSIVKYILTHRTDIAEHLSPVHSPMLCTAIYMRKYENVQSKIAALSPCVAKIGEFESTGMVEYNVTINNVYDYIERNFIDLPETPSDFDHCEAGFGGLFPMPGGFKENIELYIEKTERVDELSGVHEVYKALDEYAAQSPDKLPAIFDVLNCMGGCNSGTGCRQDVDMFDINTRMNKIRVAAIGNETGLQYQNSIFEKFDKQLNLDDFLRDYTLTPVEKIRVTPEGIEKAFISIDKRSEEARHRDCGACGSNRCSQMAEHIAKGINIPKNCITHVKLELNTALENYEEMIPEVEELVVRADRETNEAKSARDEILSGLVYASKIQKHIFPKPAIFKEMFSDSSVIWNPVGIVGGDIYWAKRFDEGMVLCVCDCTGHGTSGALLTMFVVSALESVVRSSNFKDTAGIVCNLDQKLAESLSADTERKANGEDIKDGCDIVAMFIALNGDITLSAGHMSLFVCDGTKVQRIKGQKIFVGEGKVRSKDDVDTITIPANPNNKFYVASDGLFDQPGGANSAPFGYKRFEKIILENHNKTQESISNEIWLNFEAYRGDEPRVDDVELITFKV